MSRPAATTPTGGPGDRGPHRVAGPAAPRQRAPMGRTVDAEGQARHHGDADGAPGPPPSRGRPPVRRGWRCGCPRSPPSAGRARRGRRGGTARPAARGRRQAQRDSRACPARQTATPAARWRSSSSARFDVRGRRRPPAATRPRAACRSRSAQRGQQVAVAGTHRRPGADGRRRRGAGRGADPARAPATPTAPRAPRPPRRRRSAALTPAPGSSAGCGPQLERRGRPGPR